MVVGSFNWYQNKEQRFFKHLVLAICHADNNNLSKLKKIFPHICLAKNEYSFDNAPATNYPFTTNRTKDWVRDLGPFDGELGVDWTVENIREIFELKRGKEPDIFKSDRGSFFFTVSAGGDFMSNLAKTVFYADEDNRIKIKQEFPSIVISFESGKWEKNPLLAES